MEGKTLNGPEIIISVAIDLERRLLSYHPQQPTSIPATTSPGLAVALLQKSIRRGRSDFAIAAADSLLASAPDRLWRRLVVIAVEDIGLGDLGAVYDTVVAAAHWRRLARQFGASRLVSLIVSRLAYAPKCRAADDLFVATADCPVWKNDHLELAGTSQRDLLDVVAGETQLERCAIALCLAMEAETVAIAGRVRRRRQPEVVFDFMCETGFANSLVEISRLAYRITREPFCAFLPLLHREFSGNQTELVSDIFQPETIIGGMPSWCLDGFSNEGRRALVRFLASDSDTARWLQANVSSVDRMKMLRHAQFRVEAGLVADRLIWPTGKRLQRQADFDSWPFDRENAAILLSLMRDDIEILNHMRERTYGR